ncbi:hypothetical protein Q1695_001665 [Nippostrongylus brasiliensis]|nr:hypothetical protein Q1695_001665 [Nippostrongylus brasiliensis]
MIVDLPRCSDKRTREVVPTRIHTYTQSVKQQAAAAQAKNRRGPQQRCMSDGDLAPRCLILTSHFKSPEILLHSIEFHHIA